MPTVGHVGSWRIVIYPNDHRPAHVHVIDQANGREAVFNLDGPEGSPELRENYGFSIKDLNVIEAHLLGSIEACRRRWKDIHGDH